MSGTPPAPPPRRRAYVASAVFTLVTAVLLALVAPAAAATYVPISGAGSTWSQNALDQWRANVKQYGMTVNYNGTGSSDGRNQFRNGTVDYAVSEIPYGIKDSGVVDPPPSRKYAYMPIVAGGTSFMYNLKIGNQRVTNLRLSGPVIAKIFTGGITMWNDPAIKADNPALAASLPARRVVPVVRSDGSGSTAQLTTWMSKQHRSMWDAYCGRAGRSTPCGATSNYPLVPGSGFVAQSGSNGVSGYVAQAGNIGTITYVEYSYAVYTTGFPVAKVLNAAGYYTEPTAKNVAVALLNARINKDSSSPDYLTQILDGVYNSTDRRNYPLSSYSYMVVPTTTEANFNAQKGKTLGAFAYYFLCQGQQHVDNLGYSPLPVNLVEAGLDQVRRIPGVDVENINIKNCRNPTFSADGGNTLAKSAPYPPACDKQGATQCTTGTGGDKKPTVTPGGSPGTGGSTPGATGGSGASGGSGGTGTTGGTAGAGTTGAAGASGTATGGATGSGGTTASGGATGAATAGAGTATGGSTAGDGATGGTAEGATGGTAIDPDTGQQVSALGTSGDGGAAGGGAGGDVFAVPVSTSGTIGSGARRALMVLAGVLLVGMTVGPPLLSRYLSGRRATS
ncbi:phosphate ABC transporter substrate-binding protein PstS [Streptomyces paludis]|uniref:Phosphate ABC transporter substrate-binding protein n=1 Tax=Streptomyces paludis TaxID=2282738 RepID=A0A345HM24_9ACTN|nr:phosphate ABC transporter substrate-binding protein PstS [Streptomyces paludis]AXG77748.1 phosphate ABC transporter substrate-binding protein [Streptomyces paludis]